jgi:hypothetical protein
LFQTNLFKYAPAVLLSSKTKIYKGNAVTDILLVRSSLHIRSALTPFQAIVKKFRFDVPAGLEKIPADWAKVTAAAQYTLTQRRSKIKKAVSKTVHTGNTFS